MMTKVNMSLRALGFQRDTHGLIALLVPDYGSLTAAEKAQLIEEEAERLGYLVGLGHRRIAYLSAPLDRTFATERKRGIERAVSESRVQVDTRQGTITLETGYQMTRSLLSDTSSDPPTAIIAFDDMVAVGALATVRAQGKRVPGNVSVIGFDDLFIARHTCPPLTTVEPPWLQMGQLAMRKADDLLAGRETESSGITILESPLIVSESTARLVAEPHSTASPVPR